MTTAIETPWLARYASREETGRWIERTHAVGDWSAVTDGRFIIAHRDGGVMEWPPRTERLPKVEGALRPFIDQTFPAAFTTTLSALWTFCGQIERELCETCMGSRIAEYDFHGQVERSPCTDCSQNGYYSPTCGVPRPAFVAGVLCNLNALAYSLAPELAEIGQSVRVGAIHAAPKKGKQKPPTASTLYVEEEDGRWRVVLMGLENQPDPKRRPSGWGIVPTFHPEAAFAALWLERDGECAGVLADWLSEHYPEDGFAAVLRERSLTPCSI